MFKKAGDVEYREMIDGVDMKTMAHGERTMLSHFRIRKGAEIPMHSHPQEQTGYLVSGRLLFDIEGEKIEAAPGDTWNLPSGVEHGATATEEAIVVEVFAPPREDYLP